VKVTSLSRSTTGAFSVAVDQCQCYIPATRVVQAQVYQGKKKKTRFYNSFYNVLLVNI
jgi:hypothetical protein